MNNFLRNMKAFSNSFPTSTISGRSLIAHGIPAYLYVIIFSLPTTPTWSFQDHLFIQGLLESHSNGPWHDHLQTHTSLFCCVPDDHESGSSSSNFSRHSLFCLLPRGWAVRLCRAKGEPKCLILSMSRCAALGLCRRSAL